MALTKKTYSNKMAYLILLGVNVLVISLYLRQDGELKVFRTGQGQPMPSSYSISNFVTQFTSGGLTDSFPPNGTNSQEDVMESWKKIRVLCFVLTHPRALDKQTKFVRETWGPKCDVTLYISDKNEPSFPAIAVTNYTGYRYLWAKTRNTLMLAYEKYFNRVDWFLKADDDTYVHVHNLKRFLATKDSSALEYYGKFFRPFIKNGYPSGGAGYVMGRAALKLLVTQGLTNLSRCAPESHYYAEDVAIGNCTQNTGVKLARDAYDEEKRELFHSFPPEREYILPWKKVPFYKQFSVNRLGTDACCSPNVISYHYVKGATMLFIDYLFNNFTNS